MANREISIKINGDASNFSSAVNGAADKAQGLGDRLRNVGKGMVIGAGIGAFNLLNDAVSFGIGQIGAMDEKYKTFQASQTRLGVALKNNIPNWNGNTDAAFRFADAQKQLGFNATEVLDAQGQLIGVTHDLAEAQSLVGLAEDLARSKGIDLATATDIVTKAHEGNGRALKGLGIDIGGATTASELLAAVTQNVTTTAEAYAQTSEGKTAVANSKVEASMVKIGAVIDKVAVIVLPALAAAFEYVAGVVEAVFPVISTVVGKVVGVIVGAAGIIGAIWNGVTSGIKAAINFVINTVNGAIRAINGIQVHIAVGPVKYDFNGLNLKTIPRLHFGGIVPGTAGSDVLTMLQAGERVTPAGGGGGNVTVYVQGPVYGDDIDQLADKIAMRLRLAGV